MSGLPLEARWIGTPFTVYELDLNALVDLCAKLPATVPPIPNIGIGPTPYVWSGSGCVSTIR
jgi:hypothetical protein